MFPGGISDKIGNRFEAKWTVLKLLEVFFGDAASLQFELINPNDHGVEFCLDRTDRIEWHQTKRWETNGNWTANRLEREGVLASAINKLSSEEIFQFIFVSEAPAKGLHELPHKAEIAQNWVEFDNRLSEYEREEFAVLKKVWNVDTEKAWKYLKRCQFEVVSDSSIDTSIRLLSGRAFNESPETSFPVLREYLESNFNRKIKTEDVRKELFQGKRLTPRASFDPTLSERVNLANQKYLNSYIPYSSRGSFIQRTEAAEVVNNLVAEDGRIVLLTGSAGSGKSGIVRQVIARLSELGITHIAFRVDRNLTNQSVKELGKRLLDREEDPIISLGLVNQQKNLNFNNRSSRRDQRSVGTCWSDEGHRLRTDSNGRSCWQYSGLGCLSFF